MPIEIQIQPMSEWPEIDPFDDWKYCHFGSTIFKTLEVLQRELKNVEARNVVLHTFHTARDLRRDGWVKTDARAPRDPGVILEFERPAESSGFVKLRFPCRTFQKWEDNLRAVALALEALRKVDRYGVTAGAQYAGYKALPPAEAGTQGQTPEQAAQFIADSSRLPADVFTAAAILKSRETAEFVYKTAAKYMHPDVEGGSQEEFAKLQGSMTLVRSAYNGQAQSAGGGA